MNHAPQVNEAPQGCEAPQGNEAPQGPGPAAPGTRRAPPCFVVPLFVVPLFTACAARAAQPTTAAPSRDVPAPRERAEPAPLASPAPAFVPAPAGAPAPPAARPWPAALSGDAPADPLLTPFLRARAAARGGTPQHGRALAAWAAHRADPRSLAPRAFLAAYCLALEAAVPEPEARTLNQVAAAAGEAGARWLARLRAGRLVPLDTCLRRAGHRLLATPYRAPGAAEVAAVLRAGAVREAPEGVVVVRAGAGYRAGDRLVALAGVRVAGLEDVGWALRGRNERTRVVVRFRRAGRLRERAQWLDPPAGSARVRFEIRPAGAERADPLAGPEP